MAFSLTNQPATNSPVSKTASITGATYTVDWGGPKGRTDEWRLTLGNNVTFTFQNGIDSNSYVLVLIQDTSGSRTVTWPANVDFGATGAPTLTTTANKLDYLVFDYYATTGKYRCIAQRLGYSG